MTISEYLSDHICAIAARTVFVVTAALFLMATGTQTGIIVILGIFWALLFFGMQITDFLRCRSYLQELEGIMDGLDKKYLFAECAPKSRRAYERRMMDLFRRAGRAMTTAVSDAEASIREYREYVESWVHEMKAPITAAELICRNLVRERNHQEVRRKLSLELAQVEAHVERVLFYARAENPEKDFLVWQVNLGDVVGQAIGQYRALLMENGIRVEMADLEQMVFTDNKWAAFIVGQLLQNAARYRGAEPVIMISVEEDLRESWHQENEVDTAAEGKKQVRLVVKDNGIGIPAHELPRVFDRGFTGSNGRARGGSTGMGLYLCKKLADSLEIDLEIASKAGEGTTVTLTFPAK